MRASSADSIPCSLGQEKWSFDGEEIELALGHGESGYFGVHKINRATKTTFKARLPRRPREAPYKQFSYVDVLTSEDPRECAAALAKYRAQVE